MTAQEIYDSTVKYLLDNAPQAIGTAAGGLIAAGAGWLWTRRRKGKGATSGNSNPKKALQKEGSIVQYLADVVRRGSTLSFGDPASWTVDEGESKPVVSVTLEQIWTPLRVADSQTRTGRAGTHENMTEESTGVDLRKLFDSTDQPLVILGDPGSGKSTSLAMFAVEAARNCSKAGKGRLPIWVNLASVAGDARTEPEQLLLSGVPEIEASVRRGGQPAGVRLGGVLAGAILEGKALLLLDGLDEVKEHMLPAVRRAIAHMLKVHSKARIVVACRKFDYRQSHPTRKVPIDREAEILPYSPAEQKQYVKRWYDAAVRINRFTIAQANDLAIALVTELSNNDVAQLAETPLLLALLTLIHSEEAKLPDTRAVLCDRAISYMLAEAPKWRPREAGASILATPQVRALAIQVAYENHLREVAGAGDLGVTTRLVDDLAARICAAMAKADTDKGALAPSALSRRLLNSHGLLLDIGNGRFKFAHRSFQEFLVGQYYASGAHSEEALENAPKVHWREPFRLMASFAGHHGENLYYILSLIEQLVAKEELKHVSSIQIGAEMLTEIGRRRIALRQFERVLEENGLWEKARNKLAKHVENPGLTLPERERSATTLGQLGDSRFIFSTNSTSSWKNLISLPAGRRTVGSPRLDKALLATSGGFLDTTRCVDFPPQRIGTYPVTNSEFRAFVDGDGYTNQSYWSGEMARGWITGEEKVLKLIRDHWLSTLHEHHAKEIRDGEIDIQATEEESRRRTQPRLEPYYWRDRRFNQPTQPVVGINWWEANAYCVWLTQRGRLEGTIAADEVVRLPTEFEWEYASRPADDDRIYPWGDDWAEEKAHVSTNVLNMRQPSPVGIYLEHWPNGPRDMAGNVWEWTASLHIPYAVKYDASRLSDDSLDERVVRGSSWYNSSIVAACSARAVDRSYNLFYDVGFRIVVLKESDHRACS
jgi:formylglycine-generating enzyme required for sulfatase activity